MLGHPRKVKNIEPEYCSFHKGDMVRGWTQGMVIGHMIHTYIHTCLCVCVCVRVCAHMRLHASHMRPNKSFGCHIKQVFSVLEHV
jgi:hypothetical protein